MKNLKKLLHLSGKTVITNGGLCLIGSGICSLFLNLNANLIMFDTDKKKYKGLKLKNKKFIKN